MNSNREIVALDAWDGALPDWVAVLVQECDRASQSAVAEQTGLSATAVSLAIRKRYPGNMKSIESAVRDVFMSAPVQCPALKAEIESGICLRYRKRAETWTHGNPFRVRMIRACRACPKFKPKSEE